MTNKEWLNSLTNEEFASWICDGEEFDYEKNENYPPSPKWSTIQGQYTSSKLGLLIWLKQERKK